MIGCEEKLAAANKEIADSGVLLRDLYSLLDMFNDCPSHGPRCIPHAKDVLTGLRSHQVKR